MPLIVLFVNSSHNYIKNNAFEIHKHKTFSSTTSTACNCKHELGMSLYTNCLFGVRNAVALEDMMLFFLQRCTQFPLLVCDDHLFCLNLIAAICPHAFLSPVHIYFVLASISCGFILPRIAFTF